jgi:hypothetical protein
MQPHMVIVVPQQTGYAGVVRLAISVPRVLTRRVRLHPVRLPALGQLLQNLLKHLGRIVLTEVVSVV